MLPWVPRPLAEPPPKLKTSSETNLRRSAGQTLNQSSEGDTLEDLRTEEVVEGVNREVDLMKVLGCIRQFRDPR